MGPARGLFPGQERKRESKRVPPFCPWEGWVPILPTAYMQDPFSWQHGTQTPG